MKIILDIKDSRSDFFMELMQNLDFVKVVQEFKDKHKSEAVQDLYEAFSDAKLHEQGKKKLKSAKEVLNEL